MMKVTKTWILIALLLIPSIAVHAWPIPDTGQTKCYKDYGDEIPCPAPGEAFYGQDGNYTINPPSYTKLDAAGNALADDAASWTMIRDNVTGLIWENKTSDGSIHDSSKTFTWCDTNPATNGGVQGICGAGSGDAATDTEAYIKALNDAQFGSFSDWRMPTVKELQSIVDYGRENQAIYTTFFPGTVSSHYWSSTTYARYTYYAWFVPFGDGYANGYDKSYDVPVRAVRAGQTGSLDHLVINGDGTVTDKATGLMWQQETGYGRNWQAALEYAETLSMAGYDDWRMPTVKELESIVDYGRENQAIDTTFFPGTVSFYYWSSTTHAGYPSHAWLVDFYSGFVTNYNESNNNYVRAVRAGQNRSLGSLVIYAPTQAARWVIATQETIVWDTAGISGNVKISLSRQGGKAGTFETITESTENDGSFDWTLTGPASVNCVLKIEPVDDSSKATSQGLFSIDVPAVIINPDPDSINAPWTLTGPYSYSQSGTGDQTLSNLSIGDYTIAWGDVAGWTKPSGETQAVTDGGTTTFTGTYIPIVVGTAAINPDPAINAPWTLTGPYSYSQSGTGDQALSNLPVGDYTVAWGDVAGWTKPGGETKAVTDGGTATFTGTYIPIVVGTAVVNPDPDSINAPWTLTGPYSYSQSGTGDQALSNLPVGDYTIAWGDVAGWTKPGGETKAVTDGGTTTFTGAYSPSTTLSSLDYLKWEQGYGVKYRVTDTYDNLDVPVWAVVQQRTTDEAWVTLEKEGAAGSYFGSHALGGQISQEINSLATSFFQSGCPVGNLANFYHKVQLPRNFQIGQSWNNFGVVYLVEYLGTVTVNGTTFQNCIKISIDTTTSTYDGEYTKGTGYFILAEDVGIVYIVFTRTAWNYAGTVVQYNYESQQNFVQRTISGKLYKADGSPAAGLKVRLSTCSTFNQSVIGADGSFSIRAYGPDITIYVGYDYDDDGYFDSYDPLYYQEITFNNITGDIIVNPTLPIQNLPVGTIQVIPDPDSINAPWGLTGPSSYKSGRGSQTINNCITGNYTITWGNVLGWTKPSPISETKSLTSGGAITFYGVYVQQPCAYSVSPTNTEISGSGGSRTIAVTAGVGCSWTAVSNADWITITGGSPGTGSGIVTYKVAFNKTKEDRTGTITVSGQTFTIMQKKMVGLPWLQLLLGD